MENPKALSRPSSKPSSSAPSPKREGPRTLAVDIGGTGIKTELLDERGRPLTDRARIPTPKGATPRQVLAIIRKLASAEGKFDRVSVGFPGVTKNGVIYTAPNLGKGWKNFPLERKLRRMLGRPVRVANDADVQGLGSVSGHGIELVITLGTGVGSVIFVDGHRIHLELGHHPFRKGKTYEDELGHRMLLKKGKKWWNKTLREAIDDLKIAFNYDRLYLGGGDSKFIRFEPPENVKVVGNEEGLLGGIKLWQDVNANPTPKAGLQKLRRVKRRSKLSVPTQT
jgi:polyphosphate glucokinase